MRMRSQSPPASGPRLSRTAFEIPSRPRSCTRPARRSVRISESGMPSRSPAAPASSATARAWPRKYGDLRSTKLATARSAASKRSPETTIASAGSAAITASQLPSVSRSDRITSASASITSAHRGVELLAAPITRELLRRLRAADAVRHLDELGGLRKPRGHGDVLPTPLAGPAAPVPALVRRAEGLEHLRRQLQLLAQRSRHLGVLGDHPVDLTVAREGELERELEALERGAAGPEHPQPARADRMLLSSWSYLPAFMAMSSPNHFACSCASE